MKIKWNPFQIIRIVLAALVFAAAWGAAWLYPKFTKYFVTQFGSSGRSLLAQISWGAGIAVLSIIIVTLLIGRIYCSVLCPLGIMQDALSVFPRKQSYNSWTRKVKYPVFLFCMALAVFGIMLPIILLNPSSNFVQIVNYGFREAAFRLRFCKTSAYPAVVTMIVTWAFFIILLGLVRWKGRIYCNTLCPVGTVLGIFARFSLFKMKIDTEKCVSCGACERACKAGCIDAKNKKINNEDCVMCMNCLSQCKFDALKFTKQKPAKQEIPGRRDFMISSGSLAAGLATGFLWKKRSVPAGVVMPPGAGNIDRFTSTCVGCGLCISQCRGQVLRPSVTQYGLRGFMLPHLDFNSGECRIRCSHCSNICPCGALLPISKENKKRWRIGIAQYEKKYCIAYLEGEACGACAEHCPVGALTMEPVEDACIPVVNEELCIGCGACQHICPMQPVKAITVKGVANQKLLDPPKVEEVTEAEDNIILKAENEEEFPF